MNKLAACSKKQKAIRNVYKKYLDIVICFHELLNQIFTQLNKGQDKKIFVFHVLLFSDLTRRYMGNSPEKSSETVRFRKIPN